MEDLAAFTNDLNGYLMSDGKVKPRFGTGTAKSGTPDAGRGATTPGSPGSRTQEPLRTGATQTTPTA